MNIDALKVAAIRGFFGGLVLGGIGFFAMWPQTSEIKLLITAFGTPCLGFWAWRMGLEGFRDATKAPAAPGESSISTEPPLG